MSESLNMPRGAATTEASMKDTTENILDILNDDCIMHIFRQLTHLEDLVNAANTCSRFLECAVYLKFRYRSVVIENTRNRYSRTNEVSAKNAPEFFKKFGHLVESVEWLVGNQKRADKLFNVFETYCGRTIKTLSIIVYNPNLIQKNQFPALEKLIMHDAEPMEFCLDSPIKYLEILKFREIDDEDYEPWFLREFPHLKSVRFNSTEITDETLSEFLLLNQQLSAIEVISDYLTPMILEDIGNYITDIERLDIKCHKFYECGSSELHAQLLHLSTLKKPSDLRIPGRVSLDILLNMFAENNVPIRSLGVEIAPTNAVSSFRTIETLNKVECICRSGVDANCIINLVKSQTALQTLQIDNMGATITINTIETILRFGRNLTDFDLSFCAFDFDWHAYNRILMLARNRVKVQIGVLDRDQVDVPSNILKMNKDWLVFPLTKRINKN